MEWIKVHGYTGATGGSAGASVVSLCRIRAEKGCAEFASTTAFVEESYKVAEPAYCRGKDGIVTSVPDLARKIKRYIRAYSAKREANSVEVLSPKCRIRSNEFTAIVH